MRRAGRTGFPPGRSALQGLRLLHDRLRQEEGLRLGLDLEAGIRGLRGRQGFEGPQRGQDVEGLLLLEAVFRLAVLQLLDGVATGARGHHQAASGPAGQARRLQHHRLACPAGGQIREHGQEAGAVHVAPDRLGRPPAHERQPEEGRGRDQLVADAVEYLLLARGAIEVILVWGAGVLAHAGVAERLRPVQVLLALGKAEALPEVVKRRRADLRLVVHGYASEGVDQLREVLEVDLDDVVDLQIVAHEALDRLDHERRSPDRVGGVDLLRSVPGDLGEGVARDGELPDAAEGAVNDHDAVGASRTGLRLVDRLASPLIRPDHEDVAASEEAAPAREGLLRIVGDALLDLGADQEQDQRQQQPAEHCDGHPFEHPAERELPAFPRLALAAAAEPLAEPLEVTGAAQPTQRAAPRTVDLVLRGTLRAVVHHTLYTVRTCRYGASSASTRGVPSCWEASWTTLWSCTTACIAPGAGHGARRRSTS